MNRRGARVADFCATQLIRGGGVLVIAAVIGILFLISSVALPLWRGIDPTTVRSYPSDRSVVAVDIDEHLQRLRIISRDGQLFEMVDSSIQTKTLRAGAYIVDQEHFAAGKYTLSWNDNLLTAIDLNTDQPIRYQQPMTATAFVAVRIVSGQARIVSITEDNLLTIDSKQIVDETNDDLNFIVGDDRQLPILSYRQQLVEVTDVDVSTDGRRIVVGTTNGNVILLKVADNGTVTTLTVKVDVTAIRAVKFVYGEVSFIVASAKQLSAWQEMPAGSLAKLRDFSANDVVKIAKSRRSKLFATLATDGTVQIFSLTSGEGLVFERRLPTAKTINFAPRDNALLLIDDRQIHLWSFDVRHPEITLTTLFGKVWYESYQQPALVWQSSSGTDDFEPKLSLVPLIFGTFKGTLYAMLLVLPLAIAGAVYINQFASSRFRSIIKPTIEIVASLPSVVIGFLAALWLAPFLQNFLLTFFISLTTVPLLFFIALSVWRVLQFINKKVGDGYEFAVLLPVMVCGFVIAYYLTAPLEQLFFAGDFLSWLYGQTPYDQRNSIVIAFALGFAVIPIVFSLTDDSLSSVPKQLSASSLALGASRWQTIWRVVLPSASPGIFVAAMIGFGRAVGETMIVLMATGNTPIIDSSPFNGMRTLAANIAVEVPEAPVNSTLYRTLFLCAVVLFVLTFFFNTIAEVVRSRLQERYARF